MLYIKKFFESEEDFYKSYNFNREDNSHKMNTIVWNDNTVSLEKLFKTGEYNSGYSKQKIFQRACADGKYNIAKLLLKKYKDEVYPQLNKNWCIGIASTNGHYEVVKLLLEDPRVDPSDYFNYALRKALENKEYDVAKLLLKHPKIKKESFDGEIKDGIQKMAKLEAFKMLKLGNKNESYEQSLLDQSKPYLTVVDIIKKLVKLEYKDSIFFISKGDKKEVIIEIDKTEEHILYINLSTYHLLNNEIGARWEKILIYCFDKIYKIDNIKKIKIAGILRSGNLWKTIEDTIKYTNKYDYLFEYNNYSSEYSDNTEL